ncbi:hypothetical protein LTS08_002489 [Lithohypha guttulata]|uniref:Methyltransferase-domain-containing protein n=1 Tax=Lithohypha guttulata TaxID=1690604 RepID=A0AAN7YKQ0_9EURO|nr:hypothetical protein LTR51_001659 [Lithohypha guttulata]KAK5090601.1 hypothetical protein LTR05_000776 [Lithohypha guttulata]KAK5104598.1 hypothetical protein LTS08_002489 [Lithohypha guttulata]
MVHYIRYLRTPQVKNASKKALEISAVAAVTTDLGDSFLAQDLTLVARVVDATENGEVLCLAEVEWKSHSRATKIDISCPSKFMERLVTLHVSTRDSVSATLTSKSPAVVDIWSSTFHLKLKAKAEPLVERRLQSHGRVPVRIWEETGDSIARHIWSVARKCEVFLTDLEDAQDIMQVNVDCAKPAAGSSLQRQVLEWGEDLDSLKDTKFDLVLVCDCIYNPESSVLLVRTLTQISEHNPKLLIFVAFKRRHDADDVFFSSLQKTRLRVIEQGFINLPHVMTDHDVAEPRIETFVYQA